MRRNPFAPRPLHARGGRLGALLLAAALLAPVTARAQSAPDVEEIVHRANRAAYYQGRDGRAQVEMVITDAQDRTRQRRMTILRRDGVDTDELAGAAYYGPQKYYVYFHRPADVNKMAFLVWKWLDKEDDRWLYLPALDLVKRIAATDKRTSFVGSDFFYEDVSGRSLDADVHELAETTDNFYVVRNTPRQPEAVEFSHYEVHVHKGTFLPVQIEYFDRSGQVYRRYKVLKVETVQGRPTVTRASMENLQTGSRTVMTYSDVEYDVGLPDNIFSERFLRRAPRRHLR